MKLAEFLAERFADHEPSEGEAHEAIVEWAKREGEAEKRRKATREYLNEHPLHPYVW